MKKKGLTNLYSPSDLITFMSDPFSSWMDRRYLEDSAGLVPDENCQSAVLVQKLGLLHEQQFLAKLQSEGADVYLVKSRAEEAQEETRVAMQAGREVIYQGYLGKDNFAGYSDFLMRVSGVSKLGDFHYEVWDSKLAKKPKPYFLVQLCCYAEMLELIQGCLPANISIVLGNKEIKTFRTADYYFYYYSLKRRFLEFQEKFDPALAPEWLQLGQQSRWTSIANEILDKRDDLLRVANISKSQMKRLKDAGVTTLTALANTEQKSISGISGRAFVTLKAQAKIQLDSKDRDTPLFEIVLPAKDDTAKGLSLLPPAAEKDSYFDMEGYPHIEGGLEYLLGVTSIANGIYEFSDWWAHNRTQEKKAFEEFIDWIYDRWQADPQMHVYHYGAYEISALRRLASRHATRELMLDEMLRAECFVDLYSIVRQGIRIGCDSYSLKSVELLYMDKRQGEVSKATDSIVNYERWLEQGDGESWRQSRLLQDIRNYNRIDCESTAQLCNWLRLRQNEAGIVYAKAGAKSQAVVTRPMTISEQLAEEMLSSIPADRSANHEHWRIVELLAYLLGFHRREGKVVWWELFDRACLSEEELLADSDCIAFARRSSKPPQEHKRSLLYEYYFDPSQDVRLKVGDTIVFSSGITVDADIEFIDEEYGIIRLKRGAGKDPTPSEGHLILRETLNTAPLEDAILRQVTRFRAYSQLSPCIHDFLFKKLPRVKGLIPGESIIDLPVKQSPNQLVRPGKIDEIAAAIDAISKLDESCMCIQGPPGTGKTYLAARAIVHLLGQGKRIGVSSNSHKAIENLLEEVGKAALNEKLEFQGAKVKHDNSGVLPSFSNPQIKLLSDSKITKSLSDYQLIGATAWFFARPELSGQLDYLFIDEAGQVCLANVLAMGETAKNIVLVGDQLQLEQPIKGSHPGDSGRSSLEYLLGDFATISPDRGIFLSSTRRMHPALCSFVSSAVYDDRLQADQIAAERKLLLPPVPSKLSAANGIIYLPVEHTGNSQSSMEELDCVSELIEELLECQIQVAEVVAAEEHSPIALRRLTLQDIMIVAPYNRQVRLIKSRHAGAVAGSVDRFQGREAAVVIISMCASDLVSSPRGLEFLLSKKRLNVAISRAQLLAIVIGSPALGQFACSTVEQASLLNLYCRLMQEGARMDKPQPCTIGQASS